MKFNWIQQTLADLKEHALLRTLQCAEAPAGPYIEVNKRHLLNVASNNYLDLASHPRICDAVSRCIARWGWGAGASMLVSGYTAVHAELVSALAVFEKTEDAVLFPTGYMANVGTIGALSSKADTVVMDKLCHASIVDGARMSGATIRVYPHCNLDKLERLLSKSSSRSGHTLVVTDSVFSMDGDIAPLNDLTALCKKYSAMLMIDEAHATGVLGEAGRGAIAPVSTGTEHDMLFPVRIGTLSKALGGVGGFVCGSKDLCDLLRNRARSAIYTTAPPPAACAASIEALHIIRDEPWRRHTVLERARTLRTFLIESGLRTVDGETPIIPVLVGSANNALHVARRLLDDGIFAPAIRPPTVPKGSSRLRISLMCSHTENDIRRIAEAVIRAVKSCEKI